jgi:eukaryotic-like serine/threonine-protein kinase
METIGKYQIVRVLGEGGMGRVYEAIDPIIGRRVAIKTISANVVADDEARARFFREAQAAGRLSHPNLITIHDIGEADGSPYIVMEFLDGADLGRTIRGGRLSFDRKLQIMIDVCEGLAYAHERDIVHRDIKPANIFISNQGHVKILDFGLARGALSEVTQTGRIVGTPNYMAPEQIRGEEVDHRADIFAAGVVFYELLSGRKAFEGDSVATTLYKVLETQPQPVHLIDMALPRAISPVIERALNKDKASRYPTSTDLLTALHEVRGSHRPLEAARSHALPAADRGAPPRPPAVPRRPDRSRSLWIVAAIALSAAVVGAVLLRNTSRRAQTAAAAATTGVSPQTAPQRPVPPEVPQTPPAADKAPAVVAPSTGHELKPGSPRPDRTEQAKPRPSASVPGTSPLRSAADRPPAIDAKPAAPEVTAPAVPAPAPPALPAPALAAPAPSVAPLPPAPAPRTPPAEPAVPTEDPADAVRAVLTKYQLAIESRDLDALRRIWPGLAGRQEEAMRAEFERARAIGVRLDGVTVKIAGGVATASCRRDYSVTTGDGQTLKTTTDMTMTLSRRNGAWTIDAVRHEVVR